MNLTQWEYKSIPSNLNDEELNKLGEQGWEVSAAKESSQGHIDKLLMKRVKKINSRYDDYNMGR